MSASAVAARRMSGFTALKYASFAHSLVYCALLTAMVTGADTTALGWIHGWGWIFMSIACLAAVRLRVIPIKVAAAVVILGGVGPFFGSYMFIRETRRTERVG